jgi:hypothetical protein
VQPPIRGWSSASVHYAFYAHCESEVSAPNLPDECLTQGMLRARATSKPIEVCPFALVLHESFREVVVVKIFGSSSLPEEER